MDQTNKPKAALMGSISWDDPPPSNNRKQRFIGTSHPNQPPFFMWWVPYCEGNYHLNYFKVALCNIQQVFLDWSSTCLFVKQNRRHHFTKGKTLSSDPPTQPPTKTNPQRYPGFYCHYRYHPCMVYLPTFGWCLCYMWVNIPCMDAMGYSSVS